MRMIWQAIRAVTVEAIGVGAVIYMLFGVAGWTVESVGAPPLLDVDQAWEWLQEKSEGLTASIKPDLPADQRERFAAERLDYYGQLYGDAAGSYAAQAARQLDLPLAPTDQVLPPPKNQLLGAL